MVDDPRSNNDTSHEEVEPKLPDWAKLALLEQLAAIEAERAKRVDRRIAIISTLSGTGLFAILFGGAVYLRDAGIENARQTAITTARDEIRGELAKVDFIKSQQETLKASTEHLDLSILQFEQLASAISEAPWPEIQMRGEIVQLLDRLGRDAIIPSEANPKDMSRFADNLVGLLKASKKKVDISMAIVELEGKLRSFTAETFPRSASLLQVCMGVLCEHGLLSGPLQRYSCHITDHLVEIFPCVSTLTPVFDYGVK